MSSIANNYPFLEILQNNNLLISPTFKKLLKKFFRMNSNSGGQYTGYLVGIATNDEVNRDLCCVMLDLDSRWPQLVSKFRSQVAIVSEAFETAIRESSPALEKDPDTTNAFLAGKTFGGTLLITNTKATISYGLTFNGNGVVTDYSVLWLDRFGSIMAYVVPGMEFFSCNVLHDGNGGPVSAPILLNSTGSNNFDNVGASLITFVKNFVLFCHFADIDVKIVARPGSREARKQAADKEAFVNDTHFCVRHLTANYYTTICRDESFPVRGHFRMQPFGAGHADRKLI